MWEGKPPKSYCWGNCFLFLSKHKLIGSLIILSFFEMHNAGSEKSHYYPKALHTIDDDPWFPWDHRENECESHLILLESIEESVKNLIIKCKDKVKASLQRWEKSESLLETHCLKSQFFVQKNKWQSFTFWYVYFWEFSLGTFSLGIFAIGY